MGATDVSRAKAMPVQMNRYRLLENLENLTANLTFKI